MKKWFKKLFSQDRRRAERYEPLHLVAHYWDGGPPEEHRAQDISTSGLYLTTEDRWYPGTQVLVSLQRTDASEEDPDRSIMVNARVVRFGKDGVGLEFVMPEENPSSQEKAAITYGADRKTYLKFLDRLLKPQGQALIEYVLMLPLLFLLIVNVVNLGGFFFAWIAVANAARAGADYAILGGASVGALSQASAAQINTLIAQDISSLPNRSSLSVDICQNNNGTLTALAGTCASIPFDPEPSKFVLTSIDVKYLYRPFIPAGFQFPGLKVYATIPPTTIHRRAVMRLMQ